MAALAVAASLEPPTANEELAVNPLLLASTVMMRLVGSAPIETRAVDLARSVGDGPGGSEIGVVVDRERHRNAGEGLAGRRRGGRRGSHFLGAVVLNALPN